MKRSYLSPNVPVVLLGFLIAHATPAPAQICILNELQKLTPSDAESGASVVISGDRILVGISRAGPLGNGSVHVFLGSDTDSEIWTQEVILAASDGSSNDRFGGSLAMNGSRAVIGASGDDDAGSRSGSAYVFRLDDHGTPLDPADDTWIEEAKLTASDGAADHFFGTSVSISGDHILIGASGVDDNAGAAYVFRRDDNDTPTDPNDDTWLEQAKLVASDAAAGDRFGRSAISGDRLVVGASRDDAAGPFSGSAYVFSLDDNGTPADPSDDFWLEEIKLIASDAVPGGAFGGSVSFDGETIVVGSPSADGAGNRSGAVYVFRLDDNDTPSIPDDDTWVEDAKLTSADLGAGGQFGNAVSVAGDRIVAGASISSAAKVFRLDDNGTPSDPQDDFWFQDVTYRATDTVGADRFGASVSMSGDRVAVGAGHGASYVFAVPEPFAGADDCNDNLIPDECELEEFDCNDNAIPDDCDIADGTSSDSNGNLIPDECDPPNDACEDAIQLFLGETPFDGFGATSDGGVTCSFYCDPGPCFFGDIWYEYSPPCSTVVVIDATSETGFVPSIFVYEGCGCPARQQVACRLGFVSDVPVAFQANQGVCYKIRVSTFQSLGAVTLETYGGGPTGACLLDSNDDGLCDTCVEADQGCCDDQGGTFQGAGTVCTFPEACCLNDDSCQVLDPECCLSRSGMPQGPGSACGGTEAFCDSSNGACYQADRTCGLANGDAPQGPGSTCGGTEAFCNSWTGACYRADQTCGLANGDVPQGPGSICRGTEAFCDFLTGDCYQADLTCALPNGDDPQGPGSVCAGREAFCDSSTGVCYRADRTCGLANGDAPQGPETTCGGVEACCLPDGINCLEVDIACCVGELGGVPQGSGTTCSDSDGDGVANCHDVCAGVDDAVFAPDCDGAIPTLSVWGLLVMALLLLVGGKIHFARRRSAESVA